MYRAWKLWFLGTAWAGLTNVAAAAAEFVDCPFVDPYLDSECIFAPGPVLQVGWELCERLKLPYFVKTIQVTFSSTFIIVNLNKSAPARSGISTSGFKSVIPILQTN